MNFSLATIVLTVIAFLVIKFATKLLYKLLGILVLAGVVIYLMFHFGLGPFKENPVSISTLESKYCQSKPERNKCDCIVNILKKDLKSRWTESELEEMEGQRSTMAYLLKKSFEVRNDEITACLAKRGAEEELREFNQNFVPIENDLLEEMTKLKDDISDRARNILDSLTSKKETIDERY